MQKHKYIKTVEGKIVIFPCEIEHSKFRFLNPVTVGFCLIEDKEVKCMGMSLSLDLFADPKNDSLQATNQLFGT